MKSRTFKLNKLVRDKIVQSTEEQGGSAEYHKLEANEELDALYTKLDEEMAELKNDEEPDLEKLADVREVIEAIAVKLGHTITELHAAQYDKRRKAGGFTAGIFVETVTVFEGSELAEYYAADPARFPEVIDD
jgi:predicted house-cleaning noncanonical NTP pyrophosphatase (MazG superfamily)